MEAARSRSRTMARMRFSGRAMRLTSSRPTVPLAPVIRIICPPRFYGSGLFNRMPKTEMPMAGKTFLTACSALRVHVLPVAARKYLVRGIGKQDDQAVSADDGARRNDQQLQNSQNDA